MFKKTQKILLGSLKKKVFFYLKDNLDISIFNAILNFSLSNRVISFWKEGILENVLVKKIMPGSYIKNDQKYLTNRFQRHRCEIKELY